MAKADIPVVKRSLSSWVFSSNMKLQILLVVVIAVTVFARVLPLEMQKRIVNQAIKLREFELLLIYCGVYLASVIFASGLKYLINILQTLIGQRALAEMRKQLYHHIITLPLSFFRRTQPGLVVSALVSELATAGDFIGMAIAIPITSLLTLLAFAAYLIWLNPLLALISMSIYPLVLLLIPQLQKRANRANKKRVDLTRLYSGKIAESISGVHEIHGNGAYGIENRKNDSIVDRILKVRIVWNVYRYAVKVTNNFINNLSPFVIFLLGGYLAMTGRLELGSLVAFLSAQEKLYDPWRELLDFYTAYQDASVRYYRTMEYFDLEPEFSLAPIDRKPFELPGNIDIQGLSFQTDSGIRLLDGISLSLAKGQTLAVVGFSGSGKSTLAACIGQLYRYTGGHVLIGEKEVSELTRADTVNTIGIVAQSPFIFEGTIEENLLYSYQARLDETDSEEAVEHRPSLDDMIEVLQQSGIFVDVLRFGLNAILDRERYPDLAPKLVRVRENFQRDYGELLADYVEFFDQERYLRHSSVGENLVLGTANREEFKEDRLAQNPFFLKFLKDVDLTRPLLALGSEVVRQTVDIVGNLPAEDVFFQQSPIAPEELDEFKLLAERLKRTKLHQLSEREHSLLLETALRYTPGRHKMVSLPEMLRQLILEARAIFREKIMEEDPDAFAFYDMSEYIYGQTILNNIFFGKTTTSNPKAQEKINQSIVQLLIEEDFLEKILEIGMQYQVGTKGDKLSGGQQQKLAIARVFLKQPNILIMDEATSALDNKSQTRIQNLVDTRWRGRSTVISVVHRLDTIKTYDKVAVMKAGKIVEFGPYDQLMEKRGFLYELVGKK